jgi:hypothetical protein
MGHVVRKISRAKWDPKEERGIDAISADAVTSDLRTNGNCLSFWECSDADCELELREIVLALAGTFDRLDKIDVAWIDKEAAAREGVTFKKSEGRTSVADLRKKHLNAIQLELNKISALAKLLAKAVRNDNNFRCYTKKEVLVILNEAIKKGRMSIDALPDSIRNSVSSVFEP